MPKPASRTARLEARIGPEALAIVKRAAELQGRRVSDFVAAAARDAAQKANEDAQLTRLTIEEKSSFVDLLLNPPALAPAMQRARDTHRRLAPELCEAAITQALHVGTLANHSSRLLKNPSPTRDRSFAKFAEALGFLDPALVPLLFDCMGTGPR